MNRRSCLSRGPLSRSASTRYEVDGKEADRFYFSHSLSLQCFSPTPHPTFSGTCVTGAQTLSSGTARMHAAGKLLRNVVAVDQPPGHVSDVQHVARLQRSPLSKPHVCCVTEKNEKEGEGEVSGGDMRKTDRHTDTHTHRHTDRDKQRLRERDLHLGGIACNQGSRRPPSKHGTLPRLLHVPRRPRAISNRLCHLVGHVVDLPHIHSRLVSHVVEQCRTTTCASLLVCLGAPVLL